MKVQDIIINKYGITRFKGMIAAIDATGSTKLCPQWDIYGVNIKLDKSGVCGICWSFFPRIEYTLYCPCVKYTPEETRECLQTIVDQSKEMQSNT